MKATSGIHQSLSDRDRNADEKDGDAPVVEMVTTRDGPQPRTSCHLNVLNTDSADGSHLLSIRAQNVLKILSAELTGEAPPQGRWTPSDLFLSKLTYNDLSTARNCGPQTTAEIIRWAQARGTIIRRSFPTGKSLSAMWQEAVAKFSTGELSKKEVAEALEKSARRRNTHIPVAFQRMLLRLVASSGE